MTGRGWCCPGEIARVADAATGQPWGAGVIDVAGQLVADAEVPDLDRKLAGEQKPRGWGLFLIEHMVDAMDVSTNDAAGTQTVTLRMAREETNHG